MKTQNENVIETKLKCYICGYETSNSVAFDIHMDNHNQQSFGSAEFKIVCKPDKVQLIIHGDQVAAESNVDVYGKLFDYAVKLLGGRSD